MKTQNLGSGGFEQRQIVLYEHAQKYDKTLNFAILIAEYAEKYATLVRKFEKCAIKYYIFR